MTELELKARAWDAMMEYLAYTGKCLSYREACSVVGGKAHLETLIADGKVKEIDRGMVSNTAKRMFPAVQVYAHVRACK